MRGTVAKVIRSAAKLPDGTIDRVELKRIKKLYRNHNTGQNPILPKRTRWDRSPLRRAKAPTFSGLYFDRDRPLRKIGDVFSRFNERGAISAISLAKVAGTLPRFELRQQVERIIADERNYRNYETLA